MAKGSFGKVTVVTVTYNAIDVVEETILSVLNQTYNDIEYIVVDGLSTDGTMNVVRKYADDIDVIVSEQDEGIYDAMNKAIDIASGEWTIFMNAGDRFYNSEVVQDVFNGAPESAELIYGRHAWKYGDKISIIATRPLSLMWQHISFSHQSLFAKTLLLKEKKFDLSFKIVSDYEFYFSLFMEGRVFYNSDVIVSMVSGGGLSDVSFIRRTYERWRVVKKYKNEIAVHKYYLSLLYHHLIGGKVKKMFAFDSSNK